MSDPNDPTYGGAPPPPPYGGAVPPPPAPGGGFPPPPPAQPAPPAYPTPPPPGPPGGGYAPPPPAAPGPPGGGYMPPPPAPPQMPPGAGYQTYTPGGMNPMGLTPAEPAMRLVARIIDSVLLAVVGAIIGLIFGAGAAVTTSGDISIGVAILVGVLGTAIAIAYEVVLLAQRGQTLGKMAVGIKVVRKDGSPLDLQGAAKRHSPSIILRVLGIIPIVGIFTGLGLIILAIVNIVMVFSSKESVYDKVGETMVVSAK